MFNPQHYAMLPEFDPHAGQIIREPVGHGNGYWVGAPGVFYDAKDATFYLCYRIRRPRGVEPDRGGEIGIAKSTDGLYFDDLWRGTKNQLKSPSIERCALQRLSDDTWVFYVSYVDPTDQRWRIDMVKANSPENIDLAKAEKIFTADDLGVEGVKDPMIFRVANLYHMIVSYATTSGLSDHQRLHGTADAYNTGLIQSHTGLATSHDGVNWQWDGNLLSPTANAWDAYCARIGCVWYHAPVWLALYDGSASVAENYEERVGLAYSHDLRNFHRVSRTGPLWKNPHATGALRYFDVVDFPDKTFLYYEMAKSDGSHDLRVQVFSK